MSEYSDLLWHYIMKEKRADVAEIAGHCGVNTKDIFEYIKGRNLPASDEMVQNICDFIHLTPAETERLKEMYRMTKMGRRTYRQYKKLEELIASVSAFEKKGHAPPPLYEAGREARDRKEGCLVLENERDLNKAISQELLWESRKENGHIGLVTALPLHFPIQFLTARAEVFSRTCLEQIFYFHAPGQDEADMEERLDCLREILPFYEEDMDYHSYYRYGDPDSRFYNLNLLPCLILTSESAVLFDPDRSHGLAFWESSVVSMLRQQFEEYKSACRPLIHREENAEPSGEKNDLFYMKHISGDAPGSLILRVAEQTLRLEEPGICAMFRGYLDSGGRKG